MVGTINYPIGEDEIPRRLAQLQTQIDENSASVVKSIIPIVKEAIDARDNINTLLHNLDSRVQESIQANSYTKQEIEQRASTANNGILQPANGGTGTNNAYNRDVGSVTRRAVWMDNNGKLGYALSSVRGKKNVKPTHVSEAMLRAVEIVDYQYKDDSDTTPPQIGVIAEQVQTHIPQSMIYTSADGYDEDIDNPEDIKIEGVEMSLFGILGLRLAQLEAARIDHLEQQIHTLQNRINQLEQHKE